MPLESREHLSLGRTMPLRIVGGDCPPGTSRLVCPYELVPDDSVEIHQLDPLTARVDIIDEEKTFPRKLLISRSRRRTIITMTGYLFSGPVKVSAWKDDYAYPLKEDEVDRRKLRRVKMEHVEGLDQAVQRHRERIEGVKAYPIAPRGALNIYETILFTIPRY